MRVFGLLLLTAALGGCGEAADPRPGPRHGGGRYFGIGIYPAGDLWSRMVAAGEARDATAATRDDDSQIIVVVDSRTGEIRQCGNYTGYCIGMQPWTGPLRREQAAPVGLTEHAADLQRAAAAESEALGAEAANAVTAAENSARPARR